MNIYIKEMFIGFTTQKAFVNFLVSIKSKEKQNIKIYALSPVQEEGKSTWYSLSIFPDVFNLWKEDPKGVSLSETLNNFILNFKVQFSIPLDKDFNNFAIEFESDFVIIKLKEKDLGLLNELIDLSKCHLWLDKKIGIELVYKLEYKSIDDTPITDNRELLFFNNPNVFYNIRVFYQ